MNTLATDDLRDLFSVLEDTHELVLHSSLGDPMLEAWRSAAQDARDAYELWSMHHDRLHHAAYVAAEERADAASAALLADRAAMTCPHAPLPLAA